LLSNRKKKHLNISILTKQTKADKLSFVKNVISWVWESWSLGEKEKLWREKKKPNQHLLKVETAKKKNLNGLPKRLKRRSFWRDRQNCLNINQQVFL
jgi:hypothetical protein